MPYRERPVAVAVKNVAHLIAGILDLDVCWLLGRHDNDVNEPVARKR